MGWLSWRSRMTGKVFAMNKLQGHFFRLLCEIDDVCRRHDIPYYLAEHSAWDAVKFGKYHDGIYDTCIMMTAESLARLERVAISENRQIVRDGVGQTRRYIDTSSTLFDFFDTKRFKLACVGVDVRMLIEAGDCYGVVCSNRKKKFFPRFLFDERSNFELEGRLFPLVSDYDSYLSILVSKNWGKKTWPFAIPKEPEVPYNLIYVEDLPFEVFSKRSVFRKDSSVFNSLKRWLYWQWRKRRYDKVVKSIDAYEEYLGATEDRFLCWEYYYPQKHRLQALAADDPCGAELAGALELFVDAIAKHKKKGVGLSFDEDILRIALPVLRKEKGEKYADDFVAKIPQAYREEDVGALLRRKNVDHPSLRSEMAS